MSDYSSLIKALELSLKTTQPYMDALSVIRANTTFADQLKTASDQLNVMDNALKGGIFDKSLGLAVSDMLKPYHELAGIEASVSAFGDSFKSMVRPDFYDGLTSFDDMLKPYSDSDYTAISTLKSLQQTFNSSWLTKESNWRVQRSVLAGLNISALSEISGQFASLCILEQKTSLLPGLPDYLTSAASQIASITAAFKSSISGKDLIASTKILSDFCDLASKQHILIQKSLDQEDIKWRLGVIDAASKYVDRQASFVLGLTDALAEEEISDLGSASPEIDESAVKLIPTYVGYTRKNNVQLTPSEGLQKSSIISINEKGMKIAHGITEINRIQRDHGEERIFTLSESVADGLVNISTAICTDNDKLGNIIDSLYFIFYENLEHIKVLAGGGDKKKGDRIVRDEEVYQTIFNIKTIRSELRHDLDHGDNKNKKFLEVGECFKKYCGNRPLKPKDFRKLQENLYNELLVLIDRIISMQVEGQAENASS